jgi:hypothetical protein
MKFPKHPQGNVKGPSPFKWCMRAILFLAIA